MIPMWWESIYCKYVDIYILYTETPKFSRIKSHKSIHIFSWYFSSFFRFFPVLPYFFIFFDSRKPCKPFSCCGAKICTNYEKKITFTWKSILFIPIGNFKLKCWAHRKCKYWTCVWWAVLLHHCWCSFFFTKQKFNYGRQIDPW